MKRTLAATVGLCLAMPAVAEEAINRLDRLMQGSFNSTNLESPFTDTRIRVEAPDLGEYVYYYQVNDGPELEVYRQRVLALSVDNEGVISQVALSLAEPEKYANASAEAFAGINAESFVPGLPDGCEQIWTETENGFRGYVDPTKCVVISSRTGKPRGIEAESILTADTLLLAERGYDENGKQLFGTERGKYLTLKRVND